MSHHPLFPRDAEPSSSPLPDEPRLLTRTQGHRGDEIPEAHRLHDLERSLAHADNPLREDSRPDLNSAVAHLRRRQQREQDEAAQSDAAQGKREAGAGRRWLLLMLALFAATGLLALGLSLWLRHAMHAALPQIDGTLQVAGLHGEVRVTRDAQGVPSITAASVDDVLFAQGFVTAQDRLWQMDALRRNAAGELAEVLGSALVDHDRRQRFLQVRAAADRAVAALPADQLAQLDMYANGVNAAIVQAGDKLPIEFRLLHYKPALWTPRDSLLLSLSMAQDLSTSFPQKLNREALSAHLPAALSAQLYPTGSWRDRPPTQPPVDLTAPRDVPEVPLDETQTGFAHNVPPPLANSHDLLSVSAALQPCKDCRAGSNNWAVAAARSASGSPLLSNDMHLTLSAPDIWYEAALHVGSGDSAALDATGFTLPGVPFIIVGRNAHVAWGFTNLGGDVQDLRVEHLRGSGVATEYQRSEGGWAPVGHHPERIRVRGGRDILLDVLTTTALLGAKTIETPLISPLYPSEHRALSLAWTIYDPSVMTSPFLGANQAADGPALVAALASFGAPSLNLVWADSAGHIGYHAVGRIPVRGPAVHHPRAVEPLILPENVPTEDQQDETAPGRSSEPQAQLFPPEDRDSDQRLLFTSFTGQISHLSLAAFQPVHRRRAPGPVSSFRAGPRTAGRTRNSKPVRRDSSPVLRHSRTQAIKPAAAPQVAQETLPPAPAALDYSIGSLPSAGPIDALDPAQQWSGYIPFSDLPAAQDPAGGVLATANSRVTADDYPYALTLDWVDPYRTERIYKRLEGHRQLTAADMLAVQNDIHSELDLAVAQRVAYALDHASDGALGSDKARLHQAADLLRRWKGDMRASEPAPAIVAAIRADLLPTLIAAQVAAHDKLRPGAPEALALASLYSWNASGTAVELLLQHAPAPWLPPGFLNWNDLLASITEHALERADAPRDLASWQYGALHTIEIGHPVLAPHPLLRYLLGVRGGSGRYPADGDGTTVRALNRQLGPSERFTADLAANGPTLGNLTTGQSGNPGSPWFMDQFLPWLHGTTFPLPLHAQGEAHTLTLRPSSGSANTPR